MRANTRTNAGAARSMSSEYESADYISMLSPEVQVRLAEMQRGPGPKHVCQACGVEFLSVAALKSHKRFCEA